MTAVGQSLDARRVSPGNNCAVEAISAAVRRRSTWPADLQVERFQLRSPLERVLTNVQGTGYFPDTVGVTLYAWAVPVAPRLIPLSTISVDSNGRFGRTINFPRPTGMYTVDGQQRFNDPCNCGFLPNAEARPTKTFTTP